MFWKKLSTTLLWSIVPIAGAMIADYAITIQLLHAYQAYTPFVTFSIATIVTLPVTYALVSGRLDLRKAHDQLAAARDTAIRANQAKTLFFANVSHELRTPLNAILGFSELLALDAFEGRRTEYAKLIHSSGAHLLCLVNDLLDFARIEAGKLELHCEVVNMEDLIAESVTFVEGRSLAAAVRISVSTAPEIPQLFGDRRALKQILLNLLTNAIKFTPPNGSVNLFARMAPSGEFVFGVKDTGIGIAEDDLIRVFERFGQGRHDVAAIQEGAGLGLPIVKGLVDAHGARVDMESRLGEGTCVTVWFPPERHMPRARTALAS
jgi:signal transduction histidine kinase